MSSTTGSFGSIVDVQGIKYIGTPVAGSSFNHFDEAGVLLDLPRTKGETNQSYKRRLLTVFSQRANSSYQGLLNAMTRELDLELSYPIEISPRVNSHNELVATDPYILFQGPYLYLYSDYANSILEIKIDRYEPGGYEHIGKLIDKINTTTYFSAQVIDDSLALYQKSMTIANQSNRVRVDYEVVPESAKFRLKNNYICSNTLFFSDRTVFRTEVSSEASVVSAGQYYTDYNTGITRVYSMPNPNTSVRYEYHDIAFRPVVSPVIIQPIAASDFKDKMFEQILLDDNTYADGKATSLGVSIINELLSVYGLYYGV